MIDVELVRKDFPILARKVYDRPLIYLDNAATTQKPKCVVEAMSDEYYNVNANVHRGVHYLSQQATYMHEQARETVQRFIGATSSDEIVFTRGTTESINLVAHCLLRYWEMKDNSLPFSERYTAKKNTSCSEKPTFTKEVIVSALEHHSNVVSWQLAGYKLRVIPLRDDCTLDISALDDLFNERTAIVSVTHVSNVTGTVNPLEDIIRVAHRHSVPVLVDAAQSAPHVRIDVKALGCDFLAFSGHKVYGPTGIGVLYGRRDWLDKLPPYMGGGEMIRSVTFERTTYNDPPYKFEAGTPDYIATTGLARAIEYLAAIGMEKIAEHEQDLLRYAYERLTVEIPGIDIYSPLKKACSSVTGKHSTDHHIASAVLSFNVRGIHHLDIGTLLDRLGVAVRTGHHCAEPLMHSLGVEGTVRASFAFYNTRAEIDSFIAALKRVVAML